MLLKKEIKMLRQIKIVKKTRGNTGGRKPGRKPLTCCFYPALLQIHLVFPTLGPDWYTKCTATLVPPERQRHNLPWTSSPAHLYSTTRKLDTLASEKALQVPTSLPTPVLQGGWPLCDFPTPFSRPYFPSSSQNCVNSHFCKEWLIPHSIIFIMDLLL